MKELIPTFGRDERACPTLSPHQIVRIVESPDGDLASLDLPQLFHLTGKYEQSVHFSFCEKVLQKQYNVPFLALCIFLDNKMNIWYQIARHVVLFLP